MRKSWFSSVNMSWTPLQIIILLIGPRGVLRNREILLLLLLILVVLLGMEKIEITWPRHRHRSRKSIKLKRRTYFGVRMKTPHLQNRSRKRNLPKYSLKLKIVILTNLMICLTTTKMI